MPGEGQRHKEIREDVVNFIENQIAVYGLHLECFKSHGGGCGKLMLYEKYVEDESKRDKWTGDVDIAIVDSFDKTVQAIIEIKHKDNRPKDIAGIIGAVAISSVMKSKKELYTIGKVRLYIVVDSREITDNKMRQMERISHLTNKEISNLESIVIKDEIDFKALLNLRKM